MRFLSLILALLLATPAQAFWWWNSKTSKKKILASYLVKDGEIKKGKSKDPVKLRFALISEAFLYPVPLDGSAVAQSQVGIMYKESQAILQESIKAILRDTETIDFVIFGGSQVASNEHLQLFEDMAYDLRKYSVDYYSVIGYGETVGPYASKLLNRAFYKLEVSGEEFLVINNQSDEIVPANLPEEANEQYIWLQEELSKLKQGRVFVVSYKPLSTRALGLLETSDKNFVLINSSTYNFTLQTQGKHIQLSNSGISIYPCAYTIVSIYEDASLQIQNIAIALPDIRKKAKKYRPCRAGTTTGAE